MQAKLLSFTPQIKDNVHEQYTTANGTFYRFNVTFSDGTNGTASSKSTTPSWVIGIEYTFEASTNNYGTNIRAMKKVEAPGGGGGYAPHPYDTEESKNIAYQVAMECTIQYMTFKIIPAPESDFCKVVHWLYEMLLPYTGERRTSIMSCSALKKTILIAQSEIVWQGLPKGKIEKLDHIKPIFDKIYQMILSNGSNLG